MLDVRNFRENKLLATISHDTKARKTVKETANLEYTYAISNFILMMFADLPKKNER